MPDGQPDSNGTNPSDFPEAPEDFDAALIAQVRTAENVWRAYRDELRDRLDVAADRLRRYERVSAQLTGESSKPGPKKERQFGKPRTAQDNKTRVSDTRKAELEDMVRRFAADNEEFRQIDIRSTYGAFADGGTITSSITALGFEDLRQRNVIRLARAEGNNKWFRLTREALAVES